MVLDLEELDRLIEAALAEDLGSDGDITTDAVVPANRASCARIVARQTLVVAGLPVVRRVFAHVDPSLEFQALHQDGQRLATGSALARIEGATRSILRAERTALNFLGRLCGIATATRTAVDEIAGTKARILDTRKTLPGWRSLDKYAVTAGGGVNHRMGLFDAVMIKDTHLDSGTSIEEALERVRRLGLPAERITLELRDPQDVERAIAGGAGRVLLDNMEPAELREAVRLAAGRVVLEASGGLRPGGLREVAETGVDFLSLGWSTHSARAADVAMEMEALP